MFHLGAATRPGPGLTRFTAAELAERRSSRQCQHRLRALRWGVAQRALARRCPERISFPSVRRSEVNFANVSGNPDLPLSLMMARVLTNGGAVIGRKTTPGWRMLRA